MTDRFYICRCYSCRVPFAAPEASSLLAIRCPSCGCAVEVLYMRDHFRFRRFPQPLADTLVRLTREGQLQEIERLCLQHDKVEAKACPKKSPAS